MRATGTNNASGQDVGTTSRAGLWAFFIGGPLDGRWQRVAEPIAYYTYTIPGGGMVPYTLREGVAVGSGHLIYAPVGMALHHVFEKAAHVGSPPPDSLT